MVYVKIKKKTFACQFSHQQSEQQLINTEICLLIVTSTMMVHTIYSSECKQKIYLKISQTFYSTYACIFLCMKV